MLPGGTVEKTDPTPEDTLHREAAEEAQLTLTDPVRLGWVLDETGEVYGSVGPNARLRLAARVTAIGPAAVDPATGHSFARLLATPPRQPLSWDGARQSAASPTRRGDGPRALGHSDRSPRGHRGSPCGGDAAELTRTTIPPRLDPPCVLLR
ncbi:NUDIX hydrolase [Streptomyces albulus]|nr:NUDIX hydrolase [Streptomyces noursei]